MLFDPKINGIGSIDLPLIANNFLVLYFDEIPMLYTGTNEYGDRVVGSLMCEDEDRDIFRYIHLIIRNKEYVDFINKKITYRQLIENQKHVFLIDKDFLGKIENTYYAPIENIPTEFLPHKDWLCPNLKQVVGSEFTISLKGGLADAHEALMDAVGNISKNTFKVIKDILDAIKIPGVTAEQHQLAYSPTSFGINFRVKFASNGIFYDPRAESALNEFVSNALSYSLTHLSSEAQQLTQKELTGTEYEKMITASFDKAYDLLHLKPEDKAREKLLTSIKKIPFDLEKITDELGKGFDYLEIKSHNVANNTSQPVGIIDSEFSTKLSLATDIIEAAGSKIEEDNELKEYEIHVYHLNIETRKGNAHYKNKNDKGKEIQDTPKINFEGDGILTGSIFIDSMDTGEWIKVMAKAKWINKRLKLLKIQFD